MVMEEFSDIMVAYGQSDEFSFVFSPKTTLYGRREAKIQTNLVSLFTSVFVREWPKWFEDPLQSYPSFDARCILYPTSKNLRDYLSWRQADCHINNLYNTAFWELVKEGQSERQAEQILAKTDSGGKNELLFQRGINYNSLPEMYRKGSVLYREEMESNEVSKNTGLPVKRKRKMITIQHIDIIGDTFWNDQDRLLTDQN
jgi:tRNA(His) guanylyltransferase